MVREVGRGMGVLDVYHWRERGSFGGEFGASHCNQWGLCCELSFGVVSGVDQVLMYGIEVHVPQRKGQFLGLFEMYPIRA